MGIFRINMPLLYGERESSAFKRLQMEILKESDDTSIFAWAYPSNGIDPAIADNEAFALLARSPKLFQNSHDVVQADMPVVPGYLEGIRTAVTFNNKGLHLALPLAKPSNRFTLALPLAKSSNGPTPAILGCTKRGMSGQFLAIWLQDVSANGGRYVRVRKDEFNSVSLVSVEQEFEFRMICIETWKFTQRPHVFLSDFLHSGVEKSDAAEKTSGRRNRWFDASTMVTHSEFQAIRADTRKRSRED